MEKRLIQNIRYSERDKEYQRMQMNNQHLTYQQMEQILDGFGGWADFTFKFFSDGSAQIIDNNHDSEIAFNDLTGFAFDAYIRARMDYIKSRLAAQIAV